MVSPMISDKLFSWFLGGASRLIKSGCDCTQGSCFRSKNETKKLTYHRRKFLRGSLPTSYRVELLIFFRPSLLNFSAICILIVQNAIGIQIMPTKPPEIKVFYFSLEISDCFVMWQSSVAQGNVKLLKCSKAPSFVKS